ncbi:PhnD/SsuA/transferrin family substrate-binding protein [Alteromonas sp. SM 2104]|nr:PhnD/SsuA/transferrin family substrate-binding protein [Alteromonas oceanisediminis]
MAFSLAAVVSVSVAHAQSLTFAVVPQQSAHKLAETWPPLLAEISRSIGTPIQFITAKDIPTFERRLALGHYDIAYMNPYHYVVFSHQSGYRALAKQKNKLIEGIVVVHKDSHIDTLAALNNRMLAFPAPASFAATIIVQAKLKHEGIAIRPRYVSSHDSVYLNVARQFMPAGGGVARTLNAAPDGVKNSLKVLWRSPPYTSHAIATHPAISNPTRKRLLEAMLAISENPEQRQLLSQIHFSGFEAADDAEWDDIRALDIQHATGEFVE